MCNQRYHYVYYVELGLISYKDIIIMDCLSLMFCQDFPIYPIIYNPFI